MIGCYSRLNQCLTGVSQEQQALRIQTLQLQENMTNLTQVVYNFSPGLQAAREACAAT